jgi:quercetin dioxygenase-like cupin family protein
MTIALSHERPETFAAAGCTFRILDGGGPTAGRIGVVEVDLVPGWPGPPQHLHRAHDETFYVVNGNVRFTSGTDSLIARTGQLVTAPIGDPHTFANADSEEPATVLCTVTPVRYIDYFRELSQISPGADGRLDPQAVFAVMARYATDPYVPEP